MAATTAETPQAAPPRKKKGGDAATAKTPWWLYLVVAAIVIFCLFPFYWMISISLKTGADLTNGSAYPPNPTLKNYQSVFQNGDFTRALLNSAIVSLVTTFLGIVVGAFAAYALARLKMRGKAILLAIVLSITTFPQIAIAATASHSHHGVRGPVAFPRLMLVRDSARAAAPALAGAEAADMA